MSDIPFEAVTDVVKKEIVSSITKIGDKYSIPSSIILTIMESIVKDSKLAALSTYFESIDILASKPNNPSGPVQQPSYNNESPTQQINVDLSNIVEED